MDVPVRGGRVMPDQLDQPAQPQAQPSCQTATAVADCDPPAVSELLEAKHCQQGRGDVLKQGGGLLPGCCHPEPAPCPVE
eukprot:15230033-Alexandrium_andersonii.AAC.1